MISAKFVSESLGLPGPIPGAGAFASFSSFCTDSRNTLPGCLFIALSGDLHDGHDHIASAVARGAKGVLREPRPGLSVPPEVVDFVVPNSLTAFRSLMAAWRKTFSIPVHLVAGSVGKTTTKEILAALLSGRPGAEILKTQWSQNGFVGIPMTLSRLNSQHTSAVIEVGIDDIGAMDSHWDLVRPTSAIVTAIAPEHLEKLKDLETVLREETLAVTKTLANTGRVFLNMDDPELRAFRRTLQGAYVYEFTTDPGMAPSPSRLTGRLEGESLTVSGLGLQNARFAPPLPGIHNVRNFLGALAMALGDGLSEDDLRRGLQTFRPAEGRSNLIRLKSGTLILADYYNANPASMRAGLDWLNLEWTRAGGRGRKVAVLGDMLELGIRERDFHRELADAVIAAGVGKTFLYGPRMRDLETTLRSRQSDVAHFDSHQSLATALQSELHPEDIVLLKGSRGMKMETVLSFL